MLAEEVVPVDVLMRISFRTESDATRGIIPEQNIRGFRPMSAAMSACRNSKLCPCLLALDCWRITGNSDRTAATFTQSLVGGMEAIDHEAETLLTKKTHHHKICPAPARPRARQSRSLE